MLVRNEPSFRSSEVADSQASEEADEEEHIQYYIPQQQPLQPIEQVHVHKHFWINEQVSRSKNKCF